MPAQIYRTDFPGDCLQHEIDGMNLIFHKPSGTTHFLAEPAPDMLAIIADAPCDSDTLARRLCDRLDAPLDDEALSVVNQRLAELVDSGLIRIA